MRTPARGLPWNTLAVLGGRISVPLINAAVVVLIARQEGAEALGQYSLLVAAFMLLDQARLLGLPTLVTRELVTESPAAMAAYRGLRAAGLASALVAGACLPLYAWATGEVGLAASALVLALGFFPSTAVWANDALFLARQRADRSTIVVVTEALVRGTVSALVVWGTGANLLLLSAIYVGGRILAAGVGRHLRRQLTGPLDARANWRDARRLLPRVPSFAAIAALPLILLRCDVLILGWLGAVGDVGQYSAAARLVAIVLLLPDSLLTANFVQLARAHAGRSERGFARQALFPAAAALTVAVPAAAVATLAAPRLAPAIFGPGFLDAASYLAVLVWGVPLFVLTRAAGDALIAQGHQRRVATVLAVSTPLSILMYVVATPAWGPIGTAWASLASGGTLLVLSLVAAIPLWRGRVTVPQPTPAHSLTP